MPNGEGHDATATPTSPGSTATGHSGEGHKPDSTVSTEAPHGATSVRGSAPAKKK
jgi:hypothetical protein